MSNRILFWIDVDFIYLGIAKHMLKKISFEPYAIIDVNDNVKKTFEEQKIVSFKKVWYYLDKILIDKKNPDIEYLEKIEKEYNINLWEIAYGERSFYKHNNYYKFSENEILLILEKECKFYESVLQEVKPDYLIIKMTDWQQNHLLYEMCKAKNIKILMLVPTRFGIRMMLTERINVFDKHITINQKNVISNDKNELLNYLNKYDSYKLAKEFSADYHSFTWNKIKNIIKFFLDPKNTNYLKRYSNYGSSKKNILSHQIKLAIKKRIRESYINKKSTFKIDEKIKFAFFPLHIEPERTLSIDAPYYTNQIELITNIAKSLPIGIKLLVKEHPVMKNFGWREKDFYEKILELPNVILVHPSISPKIILEKCTFVITITGTAGLEAAFYEKPSIVFADVIYSELSSVSVVKKIEDLPDIIKKTLTKKVNLDELSRFVNTIENNSFEFDINKIRTGFSNKYYFGGMQVDPNISISIIEEFLDGHTKELDMLASEHIKKIEKLKT